MKESLPRMECYKNKFSTKPQCQNEGKESFNHLGNCTDKWTWCSEHMPGNLEEYYEVRSEAGKAIMKDDIR